MLQKQKSGNSVEACLPANNRSGTFGSPLHEGTSKAPRTDRNCQRQRLIRPQKLSLEPSFAEKTAFRLLSGTDNCCRNLFTIDNILEFSVKIKHSSAFFPHLSWRFRSNPRRTARGRERRKRGLRCAARECVRQTRARGRFTPPPITPTSFYKVYGAFRLGLILPSPAPYIKPRRFAPLTGAHRERLPPYPLAGGGEKEFRGYHRPLN